MDVTACFPFVRSYFAVPVSAYASMHLSAFGWEIAIYTILCASCLFIPHTTFIALTIATFNAIWMIWFFFAIANCRNFRNMKPASNLTNRKLIMSLKREQKKYLSACEWESVNMSCLIWGIHTLHTFIVIIISFIMPFMGPCTLWLQINICELSVAHSLNN